nr:STAS domain-containing protein [Chloroflexota bacterium]
MKTIIKQQKDGSYIAVISGRIDGNNVSELTRKMTDLTGQIKWLTIDIDGLEHIDSAGIHAFLKIRKIVA